MADRHYLVKAKEDVDSAVAVYKARTRDEADTDKLLCDASRTACEALTRFCADEGLWDKYRRIDTDQPINFDKIYIPVTANALRIFGFKPPENAEKFIEEAEQALSSLDLTNLNIEDLITKAKNAINALSSVVLEISQAVCDQDRRGQWWRGVRERLWRILEGSVSGVLGAAIVAVASFTYLQVLPPANQHAPPISSLQCTQTYVGEGLKEARKIEAEETRSKTSDLEQQVQEELDQATLQRKLEDIRRSLNSETVQRPPEIEKNPQQHRTARLKSRKTPSERRRKAECCADVLICGSALGPRMSSKVWNPPTPTSAGYQASDIDH